MPAPDAGQRRASLRPDCAACTGLCCVALPFTASADFAIDKPAGRPCPNLRPDFRCGIHAQLRQRGFPGCVSFDCFGAGQRVVALTARPGTDSGELFETFRVMRHLHELLWYLAEAMELPATPALRDEIQAARREVERVAAAQPGSAPDLDTLRRTIGELLDGCSELARAAVAHRPLHRGADLVGVSWRGRDLRGADLRGALLIRADLRGADLRRADLLGADLRDADLRGADLTGSLFLTPAQLAAARGDGATAIPPGLDRPGHWPERRRAE